MHDWNARWVTLRYRHYKDREVDRFLMAPHACVTTAGLSLCCTNASRMRARPPDAANIQVRFNSIVCMVCIIMVCIYFCDDHVFLHTHNQWFTVEYWKPSFYSADVSFVQLKPRSARAIKFTAGLAFILLGLVRNAEVKSPTCRVTDVWWKKWTCDFSSIVGSNTSLCGCGLGSAIKLTHVFAGCALPIARKYAAPGHIAACSADMGMLAESASNRRAASCAWRVATTWRCHCCARYAGMLPQSDSCDWQWLPSSLCIFAQKWHPLKITSRHDLNDKQVFAVNFII